MEIVGIDFGTSNVRISTLDLDDPQASFPRSRFIGTGGQVYMPVVIALRRQQDGSVSMTVGEEADLLSGNDNTRVIRNIKRWALYSDPYVKWTSDIRDPDGPTMDGEDWPGFDKDKNWDSELQCFNEWGQQFLISDLIGNILEMAVSRAELPERFEWRAGCPVQASFDYRTMLSSVLSGIAGEGRVEWVIDEPILFLAAAQRNIDPESHARLNGSYLVYDLGGGSFDCALVEVRSDGEMTVFGADGDPLLGGSNIDRALASKFQGTPRNLREAKEEVSPENPTAVVVGSNTAITWTDVEAELKGGNFVPRSLMAMRDAYVSGKSVVFGSEIEENEDTGEVRFVWQSDYSDMARDLDGVIMFGGPTRSPYFKQNLSRWFGETKVMFAGDLIGGVADPELTGVSMGACYFPSGENFYRVPTRLPYHITLENTTTGRVEDRVEYRPHQHFVESFKPAEEFESPWLSQERDNPQDYELTITDPDGVVLERVSVDGYLEPGGRQPATGLRLVIDRLGPVYVEKRSEGVGLPWTKRITVVEHPPWQTEEQREMLDALRQRQRQHESIRRAEAGHQLSQMERHPEP